MEFLILTNTEFLTWATLKPDTPFDDLFPDGRVPIVSPISMQPSDPKAPRCYLVDYPKLARDQIRGLATLLLRQWHPRSAEEAIDYIKEGLPVSCEWFDGVTTIDPKTLALMGLDAPAFDWEARS
jgi:hypothetical protein